MGEVEEVVLLTKRLSSYGLRVQLALHLKGIPYREVHEDTQNKSQRLLEANPIHKKIPVLIHHGRPICESAIIIQYIDETWPSPDGSKDFLPKTPLARANARFWVHFIDHKVFEASSRILKSSGEQQEKAREDIISYIALLEQALGGDNTFFGGDTLGFVDVVISPMVLWLPGLDSISGGGLINLMQSKFPYFSRYMDSMREVLPKKIFIDLNEFLEVIKIARIYYLGQ